MSSELRVDRILPVDGAPTGGGGSIIQIKQAFLNTAVTSTATSEEEISTGLRAVITPKFATSKILMRAAFYFGTSGTEFTVRFKRNTTLIGTASTMDDQADGSFCIGGGSRYCTG